jgi:hypothetical protein
MPEPPLPALPWSRCCCQGAVHCVPSSGAALTGARLTEWDLRAVAAAKFLCWVGNGLNVIPATAH